MLDGVVLRGTGREVADGDGEPVAVAEPMLQSVLPRPRPGPVAAAAVGEDEEIGGATVAAPPLVDPPPGDGIGGEGGVLCEVPTNTAPELAATS